MRRKTNPEPVHWERWDDDTERCVIGVRTLRPAPHERCDLRGFIHLAVTCYATSWGWTASHVTLRDDGGEITLGLAPSRDVARAMAVYAADLYLESRRPDGLVRTGA